MIRLPLYVTRRFRLAGTVFVTPMACGYPVKILLSVPTVTVARPLFTTSRLVRLTVSKFAPSVG